MPEELEEPYYPSHLPYPADDLTFRTTSDINVHEPANYLEIALPASPRLAQVGSRILTPQC